MLLLSRFRIVGHSMQPTISPNETVLVSSLPYVLAHPKRGDIIVFKDEKSKSVMIKRITQITADGYILSGDNINDSMDSRRLGVIKRKAILGKVIAIFQT